MSLTPSGVSPDDPFVADRLETVAKRLALLSLFEHEGIEVAVAASEEEWRSPPQPAEPEPVLQPARENRQRALNNLAPTELARLAQGALLNMRAQWDEDLSDELYQVECPVLIVHGNSDTTVPIAFGEALAISLPDVRIARLDGIGHGLIVNPEAQRISTEWLKQLY